MLASARTATTLLNVHCTPDYSSPRQINRNIQMKPFSWIYNFVLRGNCLKLWPLLRSAKTKFLVHVHLFFLNYNVTVKPWTKKKELFHWLTPRAKSIVLPDSSGVSLRHTKVLACYFQELAARMTVTAERASAARDSTESASVRSGPTLDTCALSLKVASPTASTNSALVKKASLAPISLLTGSKCHFVKDTTQKKDNLICSLKIRHVFSQHMMQRSHILCNSKKIEVVHI